MPPERGRSTRCHESSPQGAWGPVGGPRHLCEIDESSCAISGARSVPGSVWEQNERQTRTQHGPVLRESPVWQREPAQTGKQVITHAMR